MYLRCEVHVPCDAKVAQLLCSVSKIRGIGGHPRVPFGVTTEKLHHAPVRDQANIRAHLISGKKNQERVNGASGDVCSVGVPPCQARLGITDGTGRRPEGRSRRVARVRGIGGGVAPRCEGGRGVEVQLAEGAVFGRPLRPCLALQPLAVTWLALEEQE